MRTDNREHRPASFNALARELADEQAKKTGADAPKPRETREHTEPKPRAKRSKAVRFNSRAVARRKATAFRAAHPELKRSGDPRLSAAFYRANPAEGTDPR